MSDDEKPAEIGLLSGMSSRQTTLMLAVLLGGTGAGTVGSTLISPYINDALEEHAEDPRAHAMEFERLNEIERRLGDIEEKMDSQGNQIATVNGNLVAVLQLLQK
jgi:hypothetical protein